MEFFINGTIDIPLLRENLNSTNTKNNYNMLNKSCTDITICVPNRSSSSKKDDIVILVLVKIRMRVRGVGVGLKVGNCDYSNTGEWVEMVVAGEVNSRRVMVKR